MYSFSSSTQYWVCGKEKGVQYEVYGNERRVCGTRYTVMREGCTLGVR